MQRREFIQGLASATAIIAGSRSVLAAANQGLSWPIGCFNRPWSKWDYDTALDGMKAAGYKITGLLSQSREEPMIGTHATPEYLRKLKERIAARGLKANMGAMRSRHNIPVDESKRQVRAQLENCKTLGLEFALTFGVDKREEYESFYEVMADAAAFAEARGIKLVMKPHGGASGASEEILRAIDRIGHPNFKIWYDAGNIIHYTGKDPVAELKPIVQHVTGFCAKDCGERKGDVMIQFGTGKVPFRKVFETLKEAGFNGPLMVECAAPAASPAAVTSNARANREFLERVLAQI